MLGYCALWNLSTKNPLHIVQMRNRDLFDFESTAKPLQFSKIPYTNVREMQYQKCDYSVVKYETFRLEETATVNVALQNAARKQKKQHNTEVANSESTEGAKQNKCREKSWHSSYDEVFANSR